MDQNIINRAEEIYHLLDQLYEDEIIFLKYQNNFQLLIGVVLTAQTTDEQVNKITPSLFGKYPDYQALSEADLSDVEEIIRTTGLFRTKAKNIVNAARIVVEEYQGQTPSSMKELLRLPGVGRKSANVVLGAAFNQPAVIVDTHFGRVVSRLGLTDAKTPDKIEKDIRQILKPEYTYRFSMTANKHGRLTCHARKPACGACDLACLCDFNEP